MAKDDYDVIVFKVLAYYYACLKRKASFSEEAFARLIDKASISELYFYDVLRMMQKEGLICGVTFEKMWGNDWILLSNLKDAGITPTGIHYLKDNNTMVKIRDSFLATTGLISSLIQLIM